MNARIQSLARQVGDELSRHSYVITTAESCTGGGIAQAVTAVAGASAWFSAGFVTYSNSAKVALLGVDERLLDSHGAVSEAVVKAMAIAAMARTAADCALAVSGIAGPGGGTSAKPVGTVWFAWCSRQQTLTRRECFGGDRESVRKQSIAAALQGVLELLVKE